MPIARSFLNGEVLNVPKDANSYINYPGASNAILAIFILFSLPVNWFCLLGWIILFFLLKKLGNHFGLSNPLSLVFATTFTSTLSILRQIPTQSIDVWMGVWFVMLMILLEKPAKTLRYVLLLGTVVGMLIGSKYSGPIYLIVFLVYAKALFKIVSSKRIVAFLTPVLLIGVFWYVRNYLAWGTPIYPGTLLWMQGIPDLDLPKYMLWKLILAGNVYGFFEALVSEYLIWAFSVIPVGIFFIKNLKHRNQPEMKKIFRLIAVSFLVLLVSLLLSFKPNFEISNMRYLFPLIILFTLSSFLIAQKYKREKEIAVVALLNAVAAVSYLVYHPKLVILFFFIVGILYIKTKVHIARLFGL